MSAALGCLARHKRALLRYASNVGAYRAAGAGAVTNH